MRHDTPPLLIGQSVSLCELKEEITRVADSDAKVLITGESGTGKELVAREIHRQSARADRAFVPVNCAGLPETLLESELFGYLKGSFTGAHRDRPGKLETADRGTVFLDEIGEMTPRMQGILLRFLETGEVQKVGSDRVDRHVNVRVVAATNRNLTEMVTAGQFREDLFYRINVIHLAVPPLRNRRDDIPILTEHFLKRFSSRVSTNGDGPVNGDGASHREGAGNGNGNGVPHANPGHLAGANGNGSRPHSVTLSNEVLQVLSEHNWPGNVRELENTIERLVVTRHKEVINVDDLPSEIRARRPVAAQPFRERRRTVASELYRRVKDGESFWTAVYPLYMNREITKTNVREIVRLGLEDARGNYKIVSRMFNMVPEDYKRFLNFLRKHECQLPFKEFR